MATRVIAIPDGDGIIRVACGSDVIEVQIVAPTSNAPGGMGGRSTSANPFGDPFASIVQDITNDPFNMPSSYVNAPKDKHGNIDYDGLMHDVQARFDNASQENPTGMLLNLKKANIHDVSRLYRIMRENNYNIPLALNFQDISKDD